MQDLERNRVLPPGGGDVLAAVKLARDPALPEVADALLGSLRARRRRAARAALRSARTTERPAFRAPIVKMLAAGTVTPPAGDILRQAAVDRSADAQTRATALAGLATATGPGALERAIDGFASLDVAAPGLSHRARQRLAAVRQLGRARAEHRDVSRADGVAGRIEADPRLRRAGAARRRAGRRRAGRAEVVVAAAAEAVAGRAAAAS